MRYTLVFPQSYIRRARKFLKKHPEIQNQYDKVIQILEINPHHPSLRLHGLHGKQKDLSSVSINMSYRIVIEFIIREDEIIFVDVGDHDRVY
jgi:mRNA-degrading endonuclease YafQ of YafQ-DinJ toxin-antitoxin module